MSEQVTMTEPHPIGTGERLKKLEDALERIASHTGRHKVQCNGRLVDVTHHDLSAIARAALSMMKVGNTGETGRG